MATVLKLMERPLPSVLLYKHSNANVSSPTSSDMSGLSGHTDNLNYDGRLGFAKALVCSGRRRVCSSSHCDETRGAESLVSRQGRTSTRACTIFSPEGGGAKAMKKWASDPVE